MKSVNVMGLMPTIGEASTATNAMMPVAIAHAVAASLSGE